MSKNIAGQIKKLILDGVPFEMSGDAEGSFTLGGVYISETEMTNTGQVYMTANSTGKITGLPIKVFSKNGSLEALQSVGEQCARGTSVSCLVQIADGSTYSALGGAMVVIDGNADGFYNLKTAEATIGIHAVNGKFQKVA